MVRRTIAALCALCGACEIGAGWADRPKREIPPAVLYVEMPAPPVAQSTPLLLAPPAAPADGTEARPFTSLAQALELAPAGALLQVDEGVWREKLEIKRPVALMGRGARRTRIMPPAGAEVAVEVYGTDHVQLHGLSIEAVPVGVRITGGSWHRLANLEFSGIGTTAVIARQAGLSLISSTVGEIQGGRTSRGIEVVGGSFEARRLVMRDAGRRAIVVQGARAVLEDLEVSGSSMAAVQALDGADVQVLRGEFDRQGGAAIYAGASRLRVEGARARHDDYGIMAARGSELTVLDDELTDYRVAGVALVNAHGTIQRTVIARGGTESAISITMADGKVPVLLVDNRIQDPGTMGVHVTGSQVTARGNAITGARPDREKDMGDGFFAIESKLVLEQNVMRANAGSGVASIRSEVRMEGNGFIGNGRAGILLLDRSRGTVTGNLFQQNAAAGIEAGERAHATLARNQFIGNVKLDIDTGCGKGSAGTADLGAGNTFAAPLRRRVCVE